MKKCIMLLVIALFVVFNCYANDEFVSDVAKKLRISQYNTCEVENNSDGYTLNYYTASANYIVETDENGIVLFYNKVSNINNSQYLPSINKNDAKGKATVFISGAAGDILENLDISTAEVTYNGNFRVVFYRKEKGIIFDGDYVTVTVDGHNGDVIQYTRMFNTDTVFENFNSIISTEDVFNRFKSLNKLELRYNKKLEGGKVVAYPVYSADSLTYYNAVNGNVIEGQNQISHYDYFDVTSMYEKISVDAVSSVISINPWEIQSKIREIYELGITDEFQVVNAKYLANGSDKYLIVLEFSDGANDISVSVDSKSGIVCEFNRKAMAYGEEKTEEQLKDIVTNYISKYMGAYVNNLKLSDTYFDEEYKVFLYERTVSGIPFKSNGICISTDKFGNITNISFLWDDIEFPSVNSVIAKNKAYVVFKEKCPYKLKYLKLDDKYIPVYALSQLTTGIIDAQTGDVLTYDGKVLQPKKYLAYIDLDNHYSKPYVEKMADCDIYVSRGNVALAEPIIQKDYLLLISQFLPTGKPVIENFGELTEGQLEMLYNAFIAAGVIAYDEVNVEGYVTRQKAVEYFIKTIGYGDVASSENIFVNYFADSDKIQDGLKGYVELARGMGIISGNGTAFMPDSYLSNGDSLIMVYNYLSKK